MRPKRLTHLTQTADTPASSDESSHSTSGGLLGQVDTVYSDNPNGTLSTVAFNYVSSAYTGQIDTTYSANTAGDLISLLTYVEDASGTITGEDSASFSYLNGIISTAAETIDAVSGGIATLVGSKLFGYDSNGDVSDITDDSYTAGALTGSSEGSYTYNTDNQVSEIDTSDYNAGNQLLTTDDRSYSYDSSGIPTSSTDVGKSAAGTLEYKDDESFESSGSPATSTDVTFNSNGTTSSESDYTFTNGMQEPTQTETWSYQGSSTTPSSSTTEAYTNGTLATSETTDYSNGEPTSAQTDTYTNGVPSLSSTETWSYSNPSEPVSTTYDYTGGTISTQVVTDDNSSNDPVSAMTTDYSGGSPVSEEFWYYNSSGDLSGTDTFDDYNSFGSPAASLWDSYDSSGDVTSSSNTTYTFGSNGAYSGATSFDYDEGAPDGTTDAYYSYNASGQFSGATDDVYDTSGALQNLYDYAFAYAGGEISQATESAYDPENIEQWSIDDGFASGAPSSVGYETYDSFGSPLSDDDYNYTAGGLSLASSENWQYDSLDTLLGYYTDSYNYANSNLSSTYLTDYGSGGNELGYYSADYNPYGYVSNDTLGFYGSSGSYLGYASTGYTYGNNDEYISGYQTSYYEPSNSLYGSVSDGYVYNSSGYLSGGSIDYSNYSSPDENGSGSLTYEEGYLSSYSSDESGEQDTTYFDQSGDPYGSSLYDDPSDYSDYGESDDDGYVAFGAAGFLAMTAHSGTLAALAVPAVTSASAGTNYFRKVGSEQGGSISSTGEENANVFGVAESPSYVVGSGDSFQVPQGATFIANIGSFSDPSGTTSDYTANINWGDGSVSAGVVSATVGGKFAVIGTHQYAKVGTYTISVPVTDNTGAEITNTCSVQVIPSLSRSSISTAASHFQAGGSTQITLTVEDPSGKPESDSGLNVVFGLTEGSAGGSFGAVTDLGDGKYTVNFTSTAAGVDTITASIDGQELTNSGYQVTVTPGPMSLAHSTLAVASASVSVGGLDLVTFTARDIYGNQETTGGLNVQFALGSGQASGIFTTVRDYANGNYTASFVGTGLGANTISAVVPGSQGLSIPPEIVVFGSSLPAPAITWAKPAAITYGTALGAGQLDASAGGIAGTFTYYPAMGTVFSAGPNQMLVAIFTPADEADYSPSVATTAIDVSRENLFITAQSATIMQGQRIPTFSVSYSGFVLGQGVGALGGKLIISSPVTPSSTAGSYAITPTGVTAANYNIIYVPGTLTITAPPVPPPVHVQKLYWASKKLSRKKTIRVLDLQFSGALSSNVNAPGAFTLDLVTKTKKHGTRYTKVSVVASYSATTDTVTLSPSGKLPNQQMQLTINAALVLDGQGRPLDGNDDGQPGGNFTKALTPSSNITFARTLPEVSVSREAARVQAVDRDDRSRR